MIKACPNTTAEPQMLHSSEYTYLFQCKVRIFTYNPRLSPTWYHDFGTHLQKWYCRMTSKCTIFLPPLLLSPMFGWVTALTIFDLISFFWPPYGHPSAQSRAILPSWWSWFKGNTTIVCYPVEQTCYRRKTAPQLVTYRKGEGEDMQSRCMLEAP